MAELRQERRKSFIMIKLKWKLTHHSMDRCAMLTQAGTGTLKPDYINREISSLSFQKRVFDEARDRTNPLLERVKFLAILGSNLDEFFMVRVGGLVTQNADSAEYFTDEMSPAEQLSEIHAIASRLLDDAQNYLQTALIPELHQAGIHILNLSELDDQQQSSLKGYFDEVVFPVLTPLAFDQGHPFPHISNLSINLAVNIKNQEGELRFARVKVPDSLPYLVPIKSPAGSEARIGPHPQVYFTWLSQVISANLGSLFPGLEVVEAHPFHVTRNAEMDIQAYEDLDLLETMEASVRKRRFGAVVRLMINPGMPAPIRDILVENLRVGPDYIYTLNGPLVLRYLMQLYKLDRPDLKYRPFAPVIIPQFRQEVALQSEAIFAAIRKENLLVHHPYESFTPVIDFLLAAAQDPNVLAIKQTLYRVGNNSQIVRALLQASRDYGKQVAVLVELKARFDEESNIGWAKMLEQEGVHVTYGLLGLKTHSKIALVIRKEDDHIRRYVHLATGNYNHITAQMYEDFGLFTCDDAIGADATDLFNYLTGYSTKADYCKLLVAPVNLRQRLEALIRQEMEHSQRGEPAHIIFKTNAIVDRPMIDLLYAASQAGVKIDLIVRGICSLRPGILGLSDNIRVISLVGRFLEHSRIYYFLNNGQETIFMGSADLMPRNLNQRVEVLFPIEEPKMIHHIRHDVLQTYLDDRVKARIMEADGQYHYLRPAAGEPEFNAQEWFISHSLSSF